MTKEEIKRVTILIPYRLWVQIRRAQERGIVESIQQCAIDGMKALLAKGGKG